MFESRNVLAALTLTLVAAACGGEPDAATMAVATGTCRQIYPSYWQDPAPRYDAQWAGQSISNRPPDGWNRAVFRLSDDFPRTLVEEIADQPWRDASFDPLFDPATDQATKTQLAQDYAWAVMEYIQEGNIGSGDVEADWTLCDNAVRKWYHMPYQTYDVLSGREFVHGLTREAPVKFSLQIASRADSSAVLASTMWAVAFFNPTAAYTLGTVWQTDGRARVPTDTTPTVSFAEGSVVGKLLFNTLSDTQFPILRNMPAWTANISAPSFCPFKGSMPEESRECPRAVAEQGVLLLQFDIAVKDSRARGTEWVYGTFVADGQRKADEPEPWNRISALGLMWGNDTPPDGGHAQTYPRDPRQNGFMEEVIFWDVVDMLNEVGGSSIPQRPGHLGCNGRLNGPADNANSSCMSCHGTASVPDAADHVPPIMTQFQSSLTNECVLPSDDDPTQGLDASGIMGFVLDSVSFSEVDRLYFGNTPAATPFDVTAQTAGGPVNILAPWPQYEDTLRKKWISLDYSLQLSISLVQWLEWLENQNQAEVFTPTIFDADLPGR